ncbi:MAG: cadherin-like domain-containing protein [Pseudomonadales bacterium]
MRTRKGRRWYKAPACPNKPIIKPPHFRMEELEPRILFSGGAEGLVGVATGAQLTQHITVDESSLPASVFKQSSILAPNTAPVFSDLDGTPTVVERGSPVVLDSDVTIFDAELSAVDNFDGTQFVLSRSGGANADDFFSATGTLDALTSGGSFVVDSVNIGSIILNGSGFLFVSFNANATNALINSAMQQIAYSNTTSHANTAPPNVDIQWTFNDQNSGEQGTGGALSTLGVTTVSFTLANDEPAVLQGAGVVIEDIAWSVDVSRGSALQDDGKLVVAAESYDGPNYQAGVLRFNQDGSLDTTFNGTGVAFLDIGTGDNVFRDVKIQTDGKILLTGFADLPGYDSVLVRYNSDGTLDTSFSGDGIANFDVIGNTDFANEIVLQDDGKIVMVGATYNGNDYDLMVTRHNSDGSLDTSFSSDGIFVMDVGSGDDIGESVALQTDGKIVVGGSAHNGANTDFAAWRLNSDGTLDTSFDSDGIAQTDFLNNADGAEKVLIQEDGKIVLVGDATVFSAQIGLVRYNVDGSLDTGFDVDGKQNLGVGAGTSNVTSATLLDDGKIIAVGNTAGASDDMFIATFNTDGSLDDSFFSNSGTSNGGVIAVDTARHLDVASDIAIQADGRILINGHSNDGGPFRITVFRLSSNGVLDTSYGAPIYVEGGPEVVIDRDIILFDLELSDTDNFAGSLVTLARLEGADSSDVFGNSGNLDPLLTSGNVVVSGTTIGSVLTNGVGQLEIELNSNATQNLVNEMMRSITYRNTSTDLPNFIQLEWLIDDGNTGAQGVGGNLQTTSTSVIRMVDVDRVFVDTTSDITDGDTSSIEALNTNRGADDLISLREAIEAANNTPNIGGADQIHFDLARDDPNFSDLDTIVGNGNELWTINLQTPLDAVSDALIIDARTQFGFGDLPLVEITGYDLDDNNTGLQFISGSSNSSVRGLSINGFDGNGISIVDAVSISLLENSLFGNSEAGIDLGDNGLTSNDAGDSDTGANNLQNSPTLNYANAVIPNTVNISGQLNSNPNTNYRIEFYASSTTDDTDELNAEYYLGFTTGSTDTNGNLFFDVSLANTVYDGESISATATVDLGGGLYGDTSEVSARVIANTINDAPVVSAPNQPLSAVEQTILAVHGVGFAVTDVDETNQGAEATLSVGEGLLSVSVGNSGVIVVNGNNSELVTLSGSIEQIDNLLQGSGTGTIEYVNSALNPSPSTTITVTVNDLGNIGSDPGISGDSSSEEGSNSQLIDLTGVNNDPFNAGSLPSQLGAIEDVDSYLDLSLLEIVDADASGGSLSLTITTSTGGLLTASNDSDVVLGGNGSGTLTISGTSNTINNYLDSITVLSYVHSTEHLNGLASDILVLSINDNGNSGIGGGADQTLGSISVDILPINDEQVLVNAQGQVDEGASIVITTAMLDGRDVDHSAAQLMYSLDTLPVNGQLQLDGEPLFTSAIFSQFDIDQGLLTYTHNGSQTSTDSFSVTVDDGVGDASSATFEWAVNNVNDAPVATGEQFELQQSTTLVHASSLTANDSDEDQDSLTVVLVDGPEHGSLTIDENGGFQYAPDASFFGVDSFSYQVSDGQELSEIVTVELAVNASAILGNAKNAPVKTITPEEKVVEPLSKTETKTEEIAEQKLEEEKSEPIAEIEEEVANEPESEPEPLGEEKSTEAKAEDDTMTPGLARSASAIFSKPLLTSFTSVSAGFSTPLSSSTAGQLPQLENVLVGNNDLAVSAGYQRSEFEFQRTAMLQQELRQFEALFASDAMNETFRKVEHSLRSDATMDEKTVQLITSSGIVASVGVISWMFSGGTLLAGMMSTLPTWAGFDPLPIMAKKAPTASDGKGKDKEDESESVDALFDK